jgi:hypothetical protein
MFLDNEKKNNQSDSWSKLDKTAKLKKLVDYVDVYSSEFNLDEEEKTILTQFLKDSLDRKKLAKVKDVIYDKKNGSIVSITGLTYYKSLKRFTIKLRTKEEEKLN